MMYPVSPQFVHMIQKQKERELEREIELARIARERGSFDQRPSWFAQAAQWVSALIFRRAPAQALAGQPEAGVEPCNCQSVPC